MPEAISSRRRWLWQKSREAFNASLVGARSALGRVPGLAAHAAKKIPLAAVTRHLSAFASELAGPRKEVPAPPPRGLFYIAHVGLELLRRIEQRSIFVLPGGVAFFFLLGLLPATTAVASLYGLYADPAELVALSARLETRLPGPVAALISGALERVASSGRTSLGLSAAVSLFMTLMSANWGTKAFCEAMNIVFDRREHRNYFEFTGVTLLMTTLAAAIMGSYGWVHIHLTGASSLAAGGNLWLPATIEGLSLWLLLSLTIGALYRYGPAPEPAEPATPLLTSGAMLAAASVIVISWILSSQLTNSTTFVRNFGPLAPISAVVIWTWVIIVMILLGAEIVEITEEEKRQKRLRTRRTPLLFRRR